MESIKVFSKAVLLSGIVVLCSATVYAETVSQTGSVTVVRGIDDAATADQRQASRGRDGVTVFRGARGASAATAVAPTLILPRQVTGGQNLWIYDAAQDEITACSLRYDFYGNRTVRCSGEQ